MTCKPDLPTVTAYLALLAVIATVFLFLPWAFGLLDGEALVLPFAAFLSAFALLTLGIPQGICRAIRGAARWLRGYGE